MGSSRKPESRLTRLQREILDAFFARCGGFFLSGGAALAGFYLHHRETHDLDLFATSEVDIEDGVRALRAAASALGAEAVVERSNPDFRRLRVHRGSELTVVYLVIDRAPQLVAEKPRVGVVRLDPLQEIAANKVCALVGRAAPRDLFDLRTLLERGYGLEQILHDAATKEGGVDPASLAWVLSDLRIGALAAVPPETSAEDLEIFRLDLVERLSRMAIPDS